MILVDSSIWIRFLANRAPYAAALDRLLEREEVAGHEFVSGELLIGDRGGRRALLIDYGRLEQAATVSHREVVDFARVRRLHGRGIGWVDVHLLASAIVGRMRLWTADRDLAVLAEKLGIAYKLPESRGLS
jgi:predicted nucleic acid-binding protein